MRRALCGVALLAALASGCANTPPTLGDRPPVLLDEREEAAYHQVLGRYSARHEIYEGFDTRLFAATTFLTAPFREARVRRLAHFQRIPEASLPELLAQERADAEREHEFILGVHANDYRYEDFAQRNSIWRLVLVTPRGEVRPTSVRRVGRATLDLRALYPYLGTFWVAYRVKFPTVLPDGSPVIPPGTETVTLRMASTVGSADLVVGAP